MMSLGVGASQLNPPILGIMVLIVAKMSPSIAVASSEVVFFFQCTSARHNL